MTQKQIYEIYVIYDAITERRIEDKIAEWPQ